MVTKMAWHRPSYSAKPFEGDDRQPFQGSVKQIVEDLATYSALDFVDEVLLDLTPTVSDAPMPLS